MEKYQFGPKIHMDDLDYDLACAIFGKPVTDLAWRKPDNVPPAALQVINVDRKLGTVTVTFKAK